MTETFVLVFIILSITGCQQKFISEYKKAGYHQGGASKKCSEQK